MFVNGGNFVPQGYLAMSENIFGYHTESGVLLVFSEARDVVKYSAVHSSCNKKLPMETSIMLRNSAVDFESHEDRALSVLFTTNRRPHTGSATEKAFGA